MFDLNFSADLYPREVIIKAAYAFTDKYYIHLDMNNNSYIVSAIPKEYTSNSWIEFENDFNNEIIGQLTHFIVSEKTSKIRQLLMGRAFASSLVVKKDDFPIYDSSYTASAENILKDWFENNEGKIEAE